MPYNENPAEQPDYSIPKPDITEKHITREDTLIQDQEFLASIADKYPSSGKSSSELHTETDRNNIDSAARRLNLPDLMQTVERHRSEHLASTNELLLATFDKLTEALDPAEPAKSNHKLLAVKVGLEPDFKPIIARCDAFAARLQNRLANHDTNLTQSEREFLFFYNNFFENTQALDLIHEAHELIIHLPTDPALILETLTEIQQLAIDGDPVATDDYFTQKADEYHTRTHIDYLSTSEGKVHLTVKNTLSNLQSQLEHQHYRFLTQYLSS